MTVWSNPAHEGEAEHYLKCAAEPLSLAHYGRPAYRIHIQTGVSVDIVEDLDAPAGKQVHLNWNPEFAAKCRSFK